MIPYKKRRQQHILLAVVLAGSFIWSLFVVSREESVIHAGGFRLIKEILFSITEMQINAESVMQCLDAVLLTVVYASAAIGLAIILGLLLALLSSELLFGGPRGRLVRGFFRGITALFRGVHELIWAWLFVAAIGLHPLAGVFALAIPYSGLLALNYRNNFDSIPMEPVEALRKSGASGSQAVLYGLLPQAFPEMVSFTISIYECMIRSSTIMSFVGLGGIGYQIQLALRDMKFSLVWMNVFALIIVVTLIDVWSSELRKRLMI